MRWRSIRVRLVVWYLAVLLLGLAGFGLASWHAMRESVLTAVDGTLRDRIEGVRRFMEAQLAELALPEIRDEFREHSVLGPGGDLFQVRDGEGRWVYRSAPLEAANFALALPDALGDKVLFEEVRVQNTPLRVAMRAITAHGKPYSVQVAAPLSEAREALTEFPRLLAVFVPFLVMLAAGGAWWISRRALAPVDRIIHAANSISIANLSGRLEVPATGDELERLSETLNAMLERLDGSVRRITQFTADASHELRAPLALIRTTAELALRGERAPDDLRRDLLQVLTESEHTSRLIENLLLLARADAGGDHLPFQPVNLAEAAVAAFDQARQMAGNRNLSWSTEVADAVVLGDPSLLHRLVLILADNAARYTPEPGSIRLRVHINVDHVLVEVEDTGIGIAAEDLPHIFDRFWRADKVRNREDGGTGLGLSIAQWIARRHQAEIEVESRPGQGSRFRVRFPVCSR